jgi:hypothetical protein
MQPSWSFMSTDNAAYQSSDPLPVAATVLRARWPHGVWDRWSVHRTRLKGALPSTGRLIPAYPVRLAFLSRERSVSLGTSSGEVSANIRRRTWRLSVAARSAERTVTTGPTGQVLGLAVNGL